jgi:hypothetical protein
MVQEKVQEKVHAKVPAGAASHVVNANPGVPAAAAMQIRSRRQPRPHLLRRLLRRPHAHLRMAGHLRRKLRLNKRQNPRITRIFRPFYYGPFARESERVESSAKLGMEPVYRSFILLH